MPSATLSRPAIVLSRAPSPGRGPRPLPARPTGARSPPAAPPAAVAQQHDVAPKPQPQQQLKIAQPKRATYILQWASSVQPGSPLAPSPSAERIQSPLLSAGTQDLARHLMAFTNARSPTAASRTVARIATALAPAPPAAKALRSPSVASPNTAAVYSNYPASAARRVHAAPSLRRGLSRQRSHRAAPARAQSRRRREGRKERRASRMLLTLTDDGVDVCRLSKPSPTNREVFLDDEEWEFAPLLLAEGDAAADEGEWVDFDGPTTACVPDTAFALHSAAVLSSAPESASVYSHPSDLAYALPAPRDERSAGRATPPPLPHAPDSARTASSHSTPGLSLLAIPARAQRLAAHLRKPSYVTATDSVTLAIPRTPESPIAAATLEVPPAAGRRRPAPLDIPPPPTAARFADASPLDLALVRAAFGAQPRPQRASGGVGAVPRRPLPAANDKVAEKAASRGMIGKVAALSTRRNGNVARA